MRRQSGFGNDSRRITDILLGINVAVFAADAILRGRLFLAGAKINELILAGQAWRFITPAFLHADVMHLAFNSMFLNSVGPEVEQISGRVRFAVIYAVAAVTGTLASFAFSSAPAVGASGALFGLAGAMWVFAQRHEKLLPNMEAYRNSLARTIGVNLLYGLVSVNVDNFGHIGGLVGGALVAFLLGPHLRLAYKNGERVLVDDPPLKILRYRAPLLRRPA